LTRRFNKAAEYGMSSNGDGEAILWAFDRIIQRKEKRKLIVVFSDGSPAYGQRGDDMYYAKKVVHDIEKDSPVDIVGIGIMDRNVELIYKEHQVIKKAHELEGVLLALIENKLK
jgi:cobalamin biosynthesis protein CobT